MQSRVNTLSNFAPFFPGADLASARRGAGFPWVWCMKKPYCPLSSAVCNTTIPTFPLFEQWRRGTNVLGGGPRAVLFRQTENFFRQTQNFSGRQHFKILPPPPPSTTLKFSDNIGNFPTGLDNKGEIFPTNQKIFRTTTF
jgi:hypothetical protein